MPHYDFEIPLTTKGDYYFISYNKSDEDFQKLKPVITRLSDAKVPLWYDMGINYGTPDWEDEIFYRIEECKEVILFYTKGILEKDPSFVWEEFNYATEACENKKITIVELDDYNVKKAPLKHKKWLLKIQKRQNVRRCNFDSEEAFLSELTSLYAPKKARADVPRQFSTNPHITTKDSIDYTPLRTKIRGPKKPQSHKLSVITGPLKRGDTIELGRFTPDLIPVTNTPIKWIVVDVDPSNKRATLLCKNLVTRFKFHCDPDGVSPWASCTLRNWLNRLFYNRVFSSEEKQCILETSNLTFGNREHFTSGGPCSEDKVFILSADEIRNYQLCDTKIKAFDSVRGDGAPSWWLRTMGSDDSKALSFSKTLEYGGLDIHKENGVRPAITVSYSLPSEQASRFKGTRRS